MLYQTIDPYQTGRLDVRQGHMVHWVASGNPEGKPAVLLHGGPGSGLSQGHRRLFDPSRYHIIQFDQRNCGRSTPYAGDQTVDLSANTTQHLVRDIEDLRRELGIDRWLVWGGSWGSTLGLAYSETHPESVTELVLSSVVSTNSEDVEWVTRVMGRVFPEAWHAFRSHLPADKRDGNLAQAYNELLENPDPAIHTPAALSWCQWEDTHMSLAAGHGPGLADRDPAFRLCFARIVTHYWANAAFMDDDHLVRNANRLTPIPTYLAHGRLDVSSPLDFAFELAESIPTAELFVAEDDGHGGSSINDWTTSVTDSLAV